MNRAAANSSWSINWPLAAVLCTLAVCATVLAVLGIIPREVVTHGIVLLLGIAVPTTPLMTRVRTEYSMHPPPMRVVSDRSQPDEEEE